LPPLVSQGLSNRALFNPDPFSLGRSSRVLSNPGPATLIPALAALRSRT
jgi:hypothetical protein